MYIGVNNANQSYDSGKLNSVLRVNGAIDFSVIHVNIRSISANGDALSVYLSTLNRELDVICLSETWVRELEFMDDFFPKRFYRVALGSIKSKNSYLPQERRNRLLKSVTKYVTLASWPVRAGSCLESIQN